MPNTIPAAGEAMPEVTMEAMIARYNAAWAAANNCEGPLEDSPEEVELHAAEEAFEDSAVKLTSHAGILDALRLAAKENEDFPGTKINVTVVKGVIAFLETQEASLEKISSLFIRWAANPDALAGSNYSGMSQEQLDATFEEYYSLQQRIIDAVPTTAKEVAQQYIVATDNGASKIPEELFDRLRQMAWGASA
ncbi:hypothetical protein [Rhizobium rhizogenes]|uniref:hypothetical protein n=1 Tax=Rhizobium rhizogenes TaxID=359 RepID=UPI0022BAC11F|nr:hypothetical protein [Rhizobium rhizogenes]MCZ7480532.1 hypothetical protein [Rhizobium rhizogenes]